MTFKYYIIRLNIDKLKDTNVPVGILLIDEDGKQGFKLADDYNWNKKLDTKYQADCKLLHQALDGKDNKLKYIKDPFKVTGPFLATGDDGREALNKMFNAII